MKYKCLSIAGFDSSGGAGIQADLKTFSALGCYGMTVLTALPVQNTCGVRKCYSMTLECIQEQLEVIFDDIVPDSIKIGMLFSGEVIELIAKFLQKHAANIPIVLDPVMVAKSGDQLLQDNAVSMLKEKLIPLATIITPNLLEGYRLTRKTHDMEELARLLVKLGSGSVLLKGGHAIGAYSNDLLLDSAGNKFWLNAKRIDSKNTHGTGCTLSAAIASYLAVGYSLYESCKLAKHYLSGAITASKDKSVGHGAGPVHHFHRLWEVAHEVI